MARGRGGIGRGRGRGGRVSYFNIERASKPPSDAYGYFLGWNGQAFSTEEFRAEYSDGRVSDSDVQGLIEELNNNKFVAPNLCPWELLFVPIILGCMGGSIGIIASNMISTDKDFFTGKITTTGTIPQESAIAGIVVMAVLGVACIITICCSANNRTMKHLLARAHKNLEIIEKHKTSVFGPKDCNLKMSPHGSYVIIEFNWKPRPAMAVVPPGYALVPTGGAPGAYAGAGMNPYQPSPMVPPGFGAGATMYNQPPPTFS